MAQSNSKRAVRLAFFANLSIAALKSVAAWWTGSSAMLAEAIHSLADTLNQLLLFVGLRRAHQPPSPQHPLGYGRELYFWSFLVALFLFTLGGLYSVWEGWHKLQGEPDAMTSPWVALVVLTGAMIAESVSFHGCIQEARKEKRKDESWWQWFRNSRQSSLIVVFGEDLAALFGLLVAFAAVLLTMLTGNRLWDALGSIVVGVLLIVVALAIAFEVKKMLVGESVAPEIEKDIKDFIESQPQVAQVFHIITQQLGPKMMVALKAKMRDMPTADALIDAINSIEQAIHQKYPSVQWIFFEPDVRDD